MIDGRPRPADTEAVVVDGYRSARRRGRASGAGGRRGDRRRSTRRRRLRRHRQPEPHAVPRSTPTVGATVRMLRSVVTRCVRREVLELAPALALVGAASVPSSSWAAADVVGSPGPISEASSGRRRSTSWSMPASTGLVVGPLAAPDASRPLPFDGLPRALLRVARVGAGGDRSGSACASASRPWPRSRRTTRSDSPRSASPRCGLRAPCTTCARRSRSTRSSTTCRPRRGSRASAPARRGRQRPRRRAGRHACRRRRLGCCRITSRRSGGRRRPTVLRVFQPSGIAARMAVRPVDR